MTESHLPRMQTERGIGDAEGLRLAEFSVRQINGVAADREAQFPKMHADLIGPTGQGPRFEERCAVRKPFENPKLRLRRRTGIVINLARADFTRFDADGRVARERVFAR